MCVGEGNRPARYCLRSGVLELRAYAKQLLSYRRRIQLSSMSIVKIDPPTSFNKRSYNFVSHHRTSCERSNWKTRVKGEMTGNLKLCGSGLVKYFAFHMKRKVGLENIPIKEKVL